jgi:nitric oxide reductase subunit B
MRMPGDVVFIVFGAVPLVIASIKGYLGVRGGAKASIPALIPAKLPA